MMKQFLFIGGSKDGECLPVSEDVYEWIIAVLVNDNMCNSGKYHCYEEPAYIKERYITKYFTVDSRRYKVFVHEDLIEKWD